MRKVIGGERGIRTLEGLLALTPLAGVRLRPLGHLSVLRTRVILLAERKNRDARKRARLWRLAVAWTAAHRDSMQGRRLRIDAIGLTGADPRTARLEHLVDVEVP